MVCFLRRGSETPWSSDPLQFIEKYVHYYYRPLLFLLSWVNEGR